MRSYKVNHQDFKGAYIQMTIRTSKRKKRICSTTSLRKKLWSAFFSPYVRLKEGYRCYTCGKQLTKETSQAGHFRHKDCLDFFEPNIHCQGSCCNTYRSGNLAIYAEKLETQYGYGIIQQINKLADEAKPLKRQELLDKIEYYKNELAKLQTTHVSY